MTRRAPFMRRILATGNCELGGIMLYTWPWFDQTCVGYMAKDFFTLQHISILFRQTLHLWRVLSSQQKTNHDMRKKSTKHQSVKVQKFHPLWSTITWLACGSISIPHDFLWRKYLHRRDPRVDDCLTSWRSMTVFRVYGDAVRKYVTVCSLKIR